MNKQSKRYFVRKSIYCAHLIGINLFILFSSFLYRNNIAPAQPCRNNNPIEDNNTNTEYQNDEGLYDLPPNEDDDANAYAEITEHPNQQEKFGTQLNQYDVLFSKSDIKSEVAVISSLAQNVDNVEYSHLVRA